MVHYQSDVPFTTVIRDIVKFFQEKFPKERGPGHIKYLQEEVKELIAELEQEFLENCDERLEEAVDAFFTVVVALYCTRNTYGLIDEDDFLKQVSAKLDLMEEREYVWVPALQQYMRKDKLNPQKVVDEQDLVESFGNETHNELED